MDGADEDHRGQRIAGDADRSGRVVAGYSASVRPNVTGAPLYAAPGGLF